MTPLLSLRKQSGFSLIEIMVGVVIGLIGIVVVFQSLSIWEARKRTTSSGSDAQIAGTIAMFNLERDLKLAGYGFGLATHMGCTVNVNATTRGVFTFGFFPVQIIDGASGTPDQINILYGNSAYFTATQNFTSATTTSKRTQSGRTGIQKGDLVIVAGGTPTSCDLVEITANDNTDGTPFTDGLSVGHLPGAYVNYRNQATTATYNQVAGTVGVYTSGSLYNLGTGPKLNIWQVRTNVLTWSDFLNTPTTAYDVAEGIVNLQAEYGVDGDNDNAIATGEWTNTPPADWSKLRAIRVALLARSQQYEKDAITTVAPSWSGGAFTMTNIDGSDGTTRPADTTLDWQHYRYRVYEKVIPLRNIIWGTAP